MELVDRLCRIPVFQRLSVKNLSLVAGAAEEQQVPPDTRLTRQADLGATFFVIDSGQAVIERVDETGTMHQVGTLQGGDHFGTTSLFVGEARDATITSTTDMHLWTIRREPFQDLVDHYPRLGRQLLLPTEILHKLRAPRYSWLDDGEVVLYHSRRHWAFLLASMAPSSLLIVAYIAFIFLLSGWSRQPLQVGRMIFPVIPMWALSGLWHWADWRNDYFAISNRRITHRERIAFMYESRNEAPLDRVQNIHSERHFLGAMLGFGNLTISTAAGVGNMLFDRVPHPERMSEALWEATARARATLRASQRQAIREALANEMNVAVSEPSPEADPGSAGPIVHVATATAPEVRPGAVARSLIWLSDRELIPRFRIETPESVTWRKHWAFLVSGTMGPILLTIVLGIMAVLGLFGIPEWMVTALDIYPLIMLFLAFMCLGWLWWQFTDWGNDLYVVTGERIIDIEKRPLFFSEQRREASLGMIQNVSLVIPDVVAATLNYGDVVVQTAGKGLFTFERVPNPREVQSEIFRRMQAFRDAQRQAEASRRRAELAEWFSVYDEIRENIPSTPGVDLPDPKDGPWEAGGEPPST